VVAAGLLRKLCDQADAKQRSRPFPQALWSAVQTLDFELTATKKSRTSLFSLDALTMT
jgi:hypothetical protein